MCVPHRSKRETRRMVAIANLFLALGIGVALFPPSLGHAAHVWKDGLGGLLIGLSIGLNLTALLRARRLRTAV